MPFDSTKLAYASNDAGKGDLNCLAHLIVAHFKAKTLPHEGRLRLYQAYLLRSGRTLGDSNKEEFEKFEKEIENLTTSEVEEEITSVLEGLYNTIETAGSGKNSKFRLKKFVALANSFGLKTEIYATKHRPSADADFTQQHVNFRPSKDAHPLRMGNLREVIRKDAVAEKVVDLVSGLEIDQTAVGGDHPQTIKLFLEDYVGGDCSCYFEYPTTTDPKKDKEDLGLHNDWIGNVIQNRQAKSSNPGVEQPLSFMDSLGGLFTMLGGILTTFMQSFLGIAQKFKHAFGKKEEPSGDKKESSEASNYFGGSEGVTSSQNSMKKKKKKVSKKTNLHSTAPPTARSSGSVGVTDSTSLSSRAVSRSTNSTVSSGVIDSTGLRSGNLSYDVFNGSNFSMPPPFPFDSNNSSSFLPSWSSSQGSNVSYPFPSSSNSSVNEDDQRVVPYNDKSKKGKK